MPFETETRIFWLSSSALRLRASSSTFYVGRLELRLQADCIGDADDPTQLSHGVLGCFLLVLPVHLAGKRDPALQALTPIRSLGTLTSQSRGERSLRDLIVGRLF